jgi:hypothetical protein
MGQKFKHWLADGLTWNLTRGRGQGIGSLELEDPLACFAHVAGKLVLTIGQRPQ